MARLINGSILFMHCAKTGGTFFREAINRAGIPNIEVGPKHCSNNEAWDHLPKDSSILKAIGFVRHPVTWYRSRWAYAKMTYFGEKIKYMPEAQKHWMANVWSEDLNTFVENTLKYYPHGIAYDYFNEMLGFNSPVTILKYENLQYEIDRLISDLGRPIAYSTLNPILESKDKTSKIAPSLINEIEVVEHKLIKRFYE